MGKSSGYQSREDYGADRSGLLPAAAAITAVDWGTVIGTAALAGIASLLTSIGGLPEELGA